MKSAQASNENSSMTCSIENARFILLVTFRKTGEEVPTPMWYDEYNGLLYMRTITDSPKTRRIHANPRVEVAPCEGDGRPLGERLPGRARLMDPTEDAISIIDTKLNTKYGDERIAMTTDFHDEQGFQFTWIEVSLMGQTELGDEA